LKTGYQPKWIKVDFVQKVIPIDSFNIDQSIGVRKGLYGLAFDRQSRIAFLPDDLTANTIMDRDQKILLRFTTTSLFSDGNEIIGLYRGHRLFDQISREDLLSAATLGGQY